MNYLIIFLFASNLVAQDVAQTNTNSDSKKNNASVIDQNDAEVKKVKRMKSVDTSAISAEVDLLKSEVLAAKTQVIILKELLKKEGLDGTQRPLVVKFQNDLGPRYQIDSLTYKLNGDIIYQYVSDESSDSKSSKPREKLEQNVVPGPYIFEVQVVYRGNDTGVFSYLKDYRITRQSKVGIDVKKINSTEVIVSTFESGWVLTDFKDRPQVQITKR